MIEVGEPTTAEPFCLVPPHLRGFPSPGAPRVDPEVRRENRRQYGAAYRSRVRSEAIAAYGGACACCGEDNPKFLTLDHKHNDGYLHRKNEPKSSDLAWYLRSKGWPKDDYQLLCWNCNLGKHHNGGTCPHEESDDE